MKCIAAIRTGLEKIALRKQLLEGVKKPLPIVIGIQARRV